MAVTQLGQMKRGRRIGTSTHRRLAATVAAAKDTTSEISAIQFRPVHTGTKVAKCVLHELLGLLFVEGS